MEVYYRKRPYIKDKIDMYILGATTEGKTIKEICLSLEEWEDFIYECRDIVLNSWSFNGVGCTYNGVYVCRRPGIGTQKRG